MPPPELDVAKVRQYCQDRIPARALHQVRLEGDPVHGGGCVDRRTGAVWHQAAIDYARETGEEDGTVTEDPDRWL